MPATTASERARYLRLPDRPGLEALHATFVRHRYALHTHDAFTIAVVDRGAASFDLEGACHVAEAGSVFVIPPHRPHTGESATPDGYTYKVLYVDPDRVAAALDSSPGHTDRRRVVTADHRSVALLGRVHNLLTRDPPSLECDELLGASLASLRPLISDQPPPTTPRRRSVGVRRARALLEERFNERISLEDLARHARLSPWHLSRSFRDAFGMPPSAFQRQLRVEHAKRQLAEGQPVAHVAVDCGFADQAHLTREFKRLIGVPPGQFRGPGRRAR